jgi:hypothetical protein
MEGNGHGNHRRHDRAESGLLLPSSDLPCCRSHAVVESNLEAYVGESAGLVEKQRSEAGQLLLVQAGVTERSGGLSRSGESGSVRRARAGREEYERAPLGSDQVDGCHGPIPFTNRGRNGRNPRCAPRPPGRSSPESTANEGQIRRRDAHEALSPVVCSSDCRACTSRCGIRVVIRNFGGFPCRVGLASRL